MIKKALITGVLDKMALIYKFLLSKGYEVHGIKEIPNEKYRRIDDIYKDPS